MSLFLMMGMALAVLMISVCRVVHFNFIIRVNQDKDYHRVSWKSFHLMKPNNSPIFTLCYRFLVSFSEYLQSC